MNSKPEIGRVKSEDIKTGIMLDGLLSGVPSVYYGDQYKTCFGSKFAPKNKFIDFVNSYNSLYQVSATSNPYTINTSLSTEVQKLSINDMNKIYKSSNWVTFIDPRVDLNFFKSDNTDLLIIHYSDQYTSSSNYDSITVTKKSIQYKNIISEFFKSKNIAVTEENIAKLIGMFNAINGDWLLKLISSKGHFPKEKISILSAIKVALAYYSHENIIWVPLSLDEILRVSGFNGLSKKDGPLSAKNLNFEKGPTSDDILLIGIEEINNKLYIHVQPIEVKIGNTNVLIDKAKIQIKHTAKEFINLLLPVDDLVKNSLERKMTRNFIMQLVITSAEKLELYGVCENQYFSKIINDYREKLLNDDFIISRHLKSYIKDGCIIAFNNAISISNYISTSSFELLEIPEQLAVEYLIKEISEIKEDIVLDNTFNSMLKNDYVYSNIQEQFKPAETINNNILKEDDIINYHELEHKPAETINNNILKEDDIINYRELEHKPAETTNNNILKEDDIINYHELEHKPAETTNNNILKEDDIINYHELEHKPAETINSNILKEDAIEHGNAGIKILLGKMQDKGDNLFWEPNDTDKILNTNTGIIGTMGTGKTQFTKSLITQLYTQSSKNIGNDNLGILIFDYKGDYNNSKEDFVEATEATIWPLYKLPFNPLALSKSKIFKPLLPLHTANSFKDTIGKIYNLGENQKQILLDCIIKAYNLKGIKTNDSNTWNRPAPTFKDVFNIYNNNEEIKKNDKLSASMNKINQFKIFESDIDKTQALYDLINKVIVIDLSNNDDDIQNLVVAITLDLFYAEMQSKGSSKLEGQYREITKLILVDEADNFMRGGFISLKKILKEGREFGVGTILSTQFLEHFQGKEDSYSEYILTWVVHKVPNLKYSDISFVFQTERGSEEEKYLFNKIKHLDKHSSIVRIGSENRFFHIKDLSFWELMQKKQKK